MTGINSMKGIKSFLVMVAVTFFLIGLSGCDQMQGDENNTTYIVNKYGTNDGLTDNQLYEKACNLASYAPQESNLKKLVEIKEANEASVEWKGTVGAKKALICVFHNDPDTYKDSGTFLAKGASFTLPALQWTFSAKELKNKEKDDIRFSIQRLKEILGLPPNNDYQYITAYWVGVGDILRPAYQYDIKEQVKSTDLDGSTLRAATTVNIKGAGAAASDVAIYEWFCAYKDACYFPWLPPTGGTPSNKRVLWTGLGWTYDWADNGETYGLSEFLVQKGAVVEIEWIKTVDDFITFIKSNDPLVSE